MLKPFVLVVLNLMAAATLAQATLAQAETRLRGHAAPIPDEIWARMIGVSWHDTLPCPTREALSWLQVPYIGFDGQAHTGQMIVAREEAETVLDIFAEISAAGFPIQSIRPVHEFAGDDDFSMAANNTSGFNCRYVSGTDRLSQHAFGRAIDINPVQNPFVTRRGTAPAAGVDFDAPQERKAGNPGVIVPQGPVVVAFKSRGWGWGGDWTSMKDYQHFSANGR